ncbi:MAG: phosphoglucosamine mutase [Gammaproteobacteria bacterium]|nr:phosphoglucosamine mutase [Gammaproteobacteria bacterium]
MKKCYFGTDGIRGRVGDGVINPEFILRLGWAAGRVLAGEKGGSVLIGKDTRISGYMFESALQAGLSAAGADIRLLGPMPTPAVAYLTRTFSASAGIVISASHNPYQDNGIKFFSATGEKLPDDVELAIEAELDQPLQVVTPDRLGKARRIVDAAGRYIEYCKHSTAAQLDLSGLYLILDCANGATYHVAPQVFSELGARVDVLADEPDGFNINAGCGSTDPAALQAAVRQRGADLGIAFDGDGDRVILVDHTGATVDGDELLCIIASEAHRSGQLKGGVVGTQMSNLGLEEMLSARGIDFIRAQVGDRFVLAELLAREWWLGGEGSGHIICRDKSTTGDAIVAALQVLNAVLQSGLPLFELKQQMQKLPQVLVNVRLEKMFDPHGDESFRLDLERAETSLGSSGRVLVRASGTEPVIRVMVEGHDRETIRHHAEALADSLRAIGGAC